MKKIRKRNQVIFQPSVDQDYLEKSTYRDLYCFNHRKGVCEISTQVLMIIIVPLFCSA